MKMMNKNELNRVSFNGTRRHIAQFVLWADEQGMLLHFEDASIGLAIPKGDLIAINTPEVRNFIEFYWNWNPKSTVPMTLRFYSSDVDLDLIKLTYTTAVEVLSPSFSPE